jgi:indoleamine 2,3-dioxygenase
MVQPILVLSDYDISTTHGFLPPETPALRSPYYAKWEAIVGDLHALLQAKKLRQTINHLPVLSTDYLETPTEWRRAYVCLVFMLNAYVWGQQNPEQVSQNDHLYFPLPSYILVLLP